MDRIISVSIIIPNYNNSLYLGDCIESCLNQGLEDYEIIVVDDHSTDGSLQVLEKYQRHNPYIIRVYTNKNKGACAARNYGYELSKGEFIQFLDSDDLLSKNKINTQLNLLKQRPKAIANCGWIHFVEKPYDKDYRPQIIDKSYSNPLSWLIDSWNGGGMGQTGCWLIPRTLIKKAGLWNETLLKNQDGEFICRVILQCNSIEFSSSNFVYYRKGINSVSNRSNFSAAKSVLESYKAYEIILKKEDNHRIRTALSKNYSSFIYLFYNRYPSLRTKAIQNIKDLGCEVRVCFSMNILDRLSQIIGLSNTMKLRKIFKGY